MRQHGCERYKTLHKHGKQKLVDYRKKYYKMWTNFALTLGHTQELGFQGVRINVLHNLK